MDCTHHDMPLAFDRAERMLGQQRQFYMVASRSDDFGAAYFPAQRDSWLQVIKASSAILAFTAAGWS